MRSIVGGALALVIGVVLAGATAFGVVQSQSNAGSDPVDPSTVSYGNN